MPRWQNYKGPVKQVEVRLKHSSPSHARSMPPLAELFGFSHLLPIASHLWAAARDRAFSLCYDVSECVYSFIDWYLFLTFSLLDYCLFCVTQQSQDWSWQNRRRDEASVTVTIALAVQYCYHCIFFGYVLCRTVKSNICPCRICMILLYDIELEMS